MYATATTDLRVCANLASRIANKGSYSCRDYLAWGCLKDFAKHTKIS